MLVWRNFATPLELVNFINENRIRQENIELMSSSDLFYWTHEALDLATYGQIVVDKAA